MNLLKCTFDIYLSTLSMSSVYPYLSTLSRSTPELAMLFESIQRDSQDSGNQMETS